MPDLTQNIGLKKPLNNETADIEVINENMDVIDAEITKKVSSTQDGRMSKEDKQKLDTIEEGSTNYQHPATHPATIITEDVEHRFVSDEQIFDWNSKVEQGDIDALAGIGRTEETVKKNADDIGDLATQMAELMPVGGIIMWSGLISNIPNGWALCDGQNGTPDLRSRFIMGATLDSDVGEVGGENEVILTENQMPSHTHSGSTIAAGEHKHNFAYNPGKTGSTGDGNYLSATASISQSIGLRVTSTTNGTATASIQNGGNHTHIMNLETAGGSQAHENKPAYYKLAFIMKV